MEDLAAELRTAAENVRDECAQPLIDGAENIEDGFGHETYQSGEMRERGEAFESWADEIESAADDIEALAGSCDHEQEMEDIQADHASCGPDDECSHEQEIEDIETDHASCEADTDEARDLADSVMAQCPE